MELTQQTQSNHNTLNIMCVLFDRCNLACKFCFESNKAKEIDIEYIKSIPVGFIKAIKQHQSSLPEVVEVTFMGGEVFADYLKDDLFDIYKNICNELHHDILGIKFKINWLSNGVFNNRDRVLNLLAETSSSISFSYDPIDRFPSDKQRNMTLDNVKYFKDYLQGILITPTKRSIPIIINNQSDLEYLKQYTNSLDLSYYIPGPNYQDFNPSNDDIFNLFKYLIDNNYFQFKDVREWLKPFINKDLKIYKTCNCDDVIMYTKNYIGNICIKLNSSLPAQRFYKDKKINESNIKFYRTNLGQSKRGCLTCNHMNYCVQPCWSTVLFDKYDLQSCPFEQLYDYINDNKDQILKQFHLYQLSQSTTVFVS